MKVIERAKNIDHRWKITDPGAKQSIAIVEKQQRAEVIMKLRSLAFDRWFLLSLKQKYSSMLYFNFKSSLICDNKTNELK